MANSKITKDEKSSLQDMKFYNPTLEVYTNEKTTIVYRDNPQCNTIEFSLSVASPDEKKFRRKVGEFYAYERFLNGYTVKMARNDFYDMMEHLYFYS